VDAADIQDLFAGLGPLRIRRMFGGQGIYSGDAMFALEAAGELYLKTDSETVGAFEAAGSRPFVYRKDGKSTAMSYWRLPEAALDDPDEAARWGRLALEAARRAAARKGEKKGRRRA
jgi:DNA transformation protein